jgi:hypothetical protein
MDDAQPAVAAVNDPDAVELGTAFVPAVDGEVTTVRFFQGPGNTGTHTGSVWASNGTRLATVTFTGETASGWQSAEFDSPVPVSAGQTYVVSYFAPQGRYAATPSFFTTPLTSGDLSAPATGNGRFRYGASGGYPNDSWNSTNYFVDVVFRRTQ